MITKEQALDHDIFHEDGCHRTVGPRGGEEVTLHVWRRNGQTQTWKTRPNDFRIPVKHGMYRYGQISQSDASTVHCEEDCPLRKEAAALTSLRKQWSEVPAQTR